MKIVYKLFALLLAISLAIGIPAAAFANGQVCKGLDSGKIDVSGEVSSLTLTAPEGTLIDGYCVKAGSANQEDGGPVYVDLLEPVSSVTISHPTGKGISHYSFSTTPIVVVEPSPTLPSEEPAPTEEPVPSEEPTSPTPEPEPTVVPTTPAPEPPTPTEPPCDAYSGGCPEPVEPEPTETPESPEPSVNPTTPAPTVSPEPKCPRVFKDALNRIVCDYRSPAPQPSESPVLVGPVVPPTQPSEAPAPFVGPKVPTQVVPNTVSDGHTVTIAEELPYTGVSAMLMFYIGVMLLGLGVLCYTVPAAFDTRRVA